MFQGSAKAQSASCHQMVLHMDTAEEDILVLHHQWQSRPFSLTIFSLKAVHGVGNRIAQVLYSFLHAMETQNAVEATSLGAFFCFKELQASVATLFVCTLPQAGFLNLRCFHFT